MDLWTLPLSGFFLAGGWDFSFFNQIIWNFSNWLGKCWCFTLWFQSNTSVGLNILLSSSDGLTEQLAWGPANLYSHIQGALLRQ